MHMQPHTTPPRLAANLGRMSTTSGAPAAPSPEKSDAPRIPHLFPSCSVGFAASSAGAGATAGPNVSSSGMLALSTLARHADKQLPVLNQRELERRRQHQADGTARPVMSLAAAASALHPSRQMPEPRVSAGLANATSDASLLASPLVSFLGRKNKRDSPRVQDNATSPRSVWEGMPKERLDPTASPRQTAASGRIVPSPPTTSSWRIHSLLSPSSSVSTIKVAASAPSKSAAACPQTESEESATKRPRLARRVSASKWRQELAPQDRTKTRERIMRSLHQHSQGDYETLLLLLASMDEELLHIKTTSSEHYAQQALALSDQVAHATLER